MANFTLNDNDWTVLHSGATSVLIQLDNKNPILVTIANAKPASGNKSGVVMTYDNLRQLGFDTIPTGQNVYGRAYENTEATIVTIAV